jgi:D-alanyl-D-alanine carboxypeptidase/D-alanyl-D-alanine-endopeptidase (penicillin-binding protein 4)
MDRDVAALADTAWRVAVAVREADRDTWVYLFNPDTALAPASNLKVLVTAAALTRWNGRLVARLDSLLAASKKPLHRRLLRDSLLVDSLEMADRPDLPGYRFLALANRQSDNDVANWLLGALARDRALPAEAALVTALSGLGVPTAGLRAVDGCGLSRDNRASPRTLATTLARTRLSARGPAFVASLAEPGYAGTLYRRRFIYPSALRAKTGYISGVFALSGFVEGPRTTYAFSFLVNGCSSGTLAYRLFDALLADLYLWDAVRTDG